MQSIKLFIFLAAVLFCQQSLAQQTPQDEVDIKSYALYEKGAWKELLQYGKTSIAAGQDFTLLRLRMAYGTFMINNFSEAIRQYEAVLKTDADNATAHYYTWLCRKYLNQYELAGQQVKYLSAEVIESAKLKPIALTTAGIESSYKYTDVTPRGNAFYTRVDADLRLGWRMNMLQSVGIYNQTIAEPKFLTVTNNNNISIDQKEYYNRTTINLNSKWQMKLAYHFLNTPFNNYAYNNHIGLLGFQYFGHYFDVKADAIFSKLTDSSRQQYNVQLALYPLGNLNFYTFSTGSLRSTNSGSFNYKQVIGFKLLKQTWGELNGTFGRFSNLIENEGMYVYNAIDINKIKVGGTLYISLSPHILAQVGYTFEQRELYQTSSSFNQHSITGGLSWKM